MKIAVYCSASENLPDTWREAARRLGRWAGSRKASIIYGGVHSGLMKETAVASHAAGAKMVGVVPAGRHDMRSRLNDLNISVGGLSDRKNVMQTLGDAFVILPGGYGTLDEFASVFAYLNFTAQYKPVVLCNFDGIYDPLLAQLNLMVDRGLMTPEKLSVLHVVTSADDMETILEKTL